MSAARRERRRDRRGHHEDRDLNTDKQEASGGAALEGDLGAVAAAARTTCVGGIRRFATPGSLGESSIMRLVLLVAEVLLKAIIAFSS